jgi:hypothetical protein
MVKDFYEKRYINFGRKQIQSDYFIIYSNVTNLKFTISNLMKHQQPKMSSL